jgi:hypothetical protein
MIDRNFKMIIKAKTQYVLITLALNLIVWACSSVSVFSPEAYKQAVDLKVESLNLMSDATMQYEDFEEDVVHLKTELAKAYEFSKGRPNNEISTRQWEILINPDGNLLGGFLKRWEEEETLSQMFLTEMQVLVGDAFDTIIGLESGKIDPSEIK